MIDDQDFEDRRKFRDRRIPQKLLPVLAYGKVRSIPEPYCVVSLPAKSSKAAQKFLAGQSLPFSTVSADDRSVSMILPEAAWKAGAEKFAKADAKVEKGYRVLAVEGDADWNAPGFVAVVGRVLGEGGIGAGIVSGYQRLHILVRTNQAKDARIQLDLLASQAKGRLAEIQKRDGTRG